MIKHKPCPISPNITPNKNGNVIKKFGSQGQQKSFLIALKLAQFEWLAQKLKKNPVLMLDDIGGEGTSVWVRDEILGPILQYRLLDHKPTFFSSNYSRKKLVQDHFAKFSRETDNLNATRIGIRIAELTKDNEIQL